MSHVLYLNVNDKFLIDRKTKNALYRKYVLYSITLTRTNTERLIFQVKVKFNKMQGLAVGDCLNKNRETEEEVTNIINA